MYLILTLADTVEAITDTASWVKTLENGATVLCQASEATAIYAHETDSFYRLRAAYPGDAVHHVIEMDTVPEGAEPGTWRWVDGALVADPEAIAAKARAVAQRPEQLRADMDYIMLMEGL